MFRLRVIGIALLLAACATGPTPLETTLRVWDLGALEAISIGRWRSLLISGAGTDWARVVSCRPDGACTYFGSTQGSFGPSTDFFVFGEVPEQIFQWARTYGGFDADELDGAVTLSDGGHLLFGLSSSPFGAAAGAAALAPRPLLVRIDAGGTPRWARTLESSGIERLHGAAAVGEEAVLVGYAGLGGDTPSVAVVRIASDGSLRWAQRYDLGGPGYAVAGAPDATGGTVIAGYLRAPNVPFAGTPFLLAVDAAGRPRWARRYDTGGPAQPRALVAMPDGSLALAGSVFGRRPARSAFLFRVGQDGAVRLGRELRGLDPVEMFAAADAGEGRVVLAGRRRDSFTDRHFGVALLVDAPGRVIGHATVRASGSVEFASVATARVAEYRVAGSTNSLGAAGLDALVAAWYPATAGPGAPVASRIAELDLAVTVTEVTAGPQALPATATPVPPEALEVRTLEVPTAGMTLRPRR